MQAYSTDELRSLRSSLIDQGGYLGDDSFRSQVEWRPMGRNSHQLVLKKSVIAADAAQTSEDPVSLSAVVFIPCSDFWLTGWHSWKPTRYTPTLADLKLSCTGEVPADVDIFRDDFTKVLENIDWLMKTSATPGFENNKGLVVGVVPCNCGGNHTPPSPPSPPGSSDKPERKLQVQHILFSPVDPSDTEDTDDLPSAFKIENWPAYSDVVKAALAAMHTSHTVNPVLAYDIDEKLIVPQRYRTRLVGAVVIIRFTVTHWSFGRRVNDPAVDRYVANLVHMRVLVPPKSKGPVTPRKRKIPLTDTTSPPLRRISQSNKRQRIE